ncbi:MAG: molybdopterin-guanine dinucleotide biosynthesis protein B [Candidatus Heimdallarchaeota archaeon]|nr:molybdopterin-guanine dinucleotide biosynthesis protein B [Candidatus Heimdallarchaeota archaeon]
MIKPKILQIIGYAGTGKTSIICSILEKLSKENFNCATIKSSRKHSYSFSKKDSDEFLRSGSNLSVVVFDNTTQITINEQINLERLITEISNISDPDFLIIEGFKDEKYPKLLIWTEKILDEAIDFTTIKFLYCDSNDYESNKLVIDEFVSKYDVLFNTEVNETLQNILEYFIS